MPDKLTIDQFAQKIKDKYPEYKDMDNTELSNKIINKYPEYKDQVDYEVKKKEPSEPLSSKPSQPLQENLPSFAQPKEEGVSLFDVPGQESTSKSPRPTPPTKGEHPKDIAIAEKINSDMDKLWPIETPDQKLRSFDSWKQKLTEKYDPELEAATTDTERKSIKERALKELDQKATDIGLETVVDKQGNTRYVPNKNELEKYQQTLEKTIQKHTPSDGKTNKGFWKSAYYSLAAGSAGMLRDLGSVQDFVLPWKKFAQTPEEQKANQEWQDENIQKLSEQGKYYDEGASDYLRKGENGKAVGALFLGAAEQVPLLVGLGMTGGESALAKATLGVLSAGSGLTKYKELDKENISELAKIYNAGMTSLTFAAIGELNVNKLVATMGKDNAIPIIQQSLKAPLQRAAEAVTKTTGQASESFAVGFSTTVANNMVTKATVDPNQNIWDGAVDTGLLFASMAKFGGLAKEGMNEMRARMKKIPTNIPVEDKAKALELLTEKDNLTKENEIIDESFQSGNKEKVAEINKKVAVITQPRSVKEKIDLINKNIDKELANEYPDVKKLSDLDAKREEIESSINMKPEMKEINTEIESLKKERDGLYDGKAESDIQKNAPKEEALNKKIIKLLNKKQATKKKFYDEVLETLDDGFDRELYREDKEQAHKELKKEIPSVESHEELRPKIEEPKAEVVQDEKLSEQIEQPKAGAEGAKIEKAPEVQEEPVVNIEKRINSTSEYEANGQNISRLRELKQELSENKGKAKTAFEIMDFAKKLWGGDLAEEMTKHPLTHIGNFYHFHESLKGFVDKQIENEKYNIEKNKEHIASLGKSKSDIKQKGFHEESIKTSEDYMKRIQDEYSKHIESNSTEPTKTPTPKPEPEKTVLESDVKSEEIQPKKIKEAAKNIADTLRKGKLSRPDVFSTATPASLVWDGAIEIAAKTVEARGDMAQAVADGIKHIRNSEWYKNFDKKEEAEKAFEKYVTDSHGEKKETGIRHASTAEARRELGLGEYERVSESREELKARAGEAIKGGYNVDSLMTGVENKTKYYGELEQAILTEYVSGLKKKIESDPSDKNISDYNRAVKILDVEGSVGGKILANRVGTFEPDDSLAGFFSSKIESTGSEILTETQKAEVQKKYDDINKAVKAEEEALANLKNEIAKAKSEKALNELKKTTPRTPKKSHAEFATERDAIRSSIRDKWKKAANDGTLNALPLPYAKQLAYITPDVLKLAKSYIGEGVVTLKEMVSKLHEDLKDDIQGLTEEDVHNILAGEFKEKRQTKSDIQIQLEDLKEEARLLNKLKRIESGTEPAKEKDKRTRNKEITDLRKKVRDLKRASGEADLGGLITRVNNDIKKLEENLRTKNYAKEEPKTPILEREDVKNNFPDLHKKAVEATDKRIKLKDDWELELLLDKHERRSKLEKAGDIMLEVTNISKGLIGGGDLSAVLRQAVVASVNHPILAARNFKFMLKATKSENFYKRWLDDLSKSSDWHIIKQAGLAISDPTSPMNRFHEELYQSSILGKIPILGKSVHIPLGKGKVTAKKYGGFLSASERAFSGYLNKMRVDLFREQAKAYADQGKSISNSKELYKETAKLINDVTGSGSLGDLATVSKILSIGIWSPKLIASRLRLLTNFANPYFYNKAPVEVRKMYFKEMATFIAAGTSLLAMVSLIPGVTVEKDPRSSDFGKIKVGDTRYDIWGGFQPYVRFATQFLSGEKKTAEGKIIKLGEQYGSDDRGDIAGKFLRTKLAPAAGSVWNVVVGKDVTGKPVTIGGEILKNLYPIWIGDTWSSAEKGGALKAAAEIPLNVLGVGVQQYGSKEASLVEKEHLDKYVAKYTKEHDPSGKIDSEALSTYAQLQYAIGKAEKSEKELMESDKTPKEITAAIKEAGNDKYLKFVKDNNTEIEKFKDIMANFKELDEATQDKYSSKIDKSIKEITTAFEKNRKYRLSSNMKQVEKILEKKGLVKSKRKEAVNRMLK